MKFNSFLVSACAAAVLSACGGGGSTASNDNSSPQAGAGAKLSGTAAGGAAIIGSVFIKDKLGAEKSAVIEADGHYDIDVSGMTGPFMLKAVGTVGGNLVSYYSAATNADVNGTVNVTPFTSLIVSNIAAEIAESYYNNPDKFGSTLNAAALTEAKSNLQKKLAPTLQALGLDTSIDLMKASFKADHSGMDAALDVIKVEIDPNTNVATLKNALTDQKIGEDQLNSKADDATPVTLSDEDKTKLAGVQTDLQKVEELFRKFETLFATGLPSVQQLTDSGVFVTNDKFMMSGSTFAQFANEITTDDGVIGVKFGNTDIAFDSTNPNAATVRVVITSKDGKTEKLRLRVGRPDSGSPWKIVGDGKIADIGLTSLAQRSVYATGSFISNGVQLTIYPSNYNVNHPDAKITAAVITGPGLPQTGVQYQADDSLPYLRLATGGNVIPECATSNGYANCVTIANMVDNGEYNIKLFTGAVPVDANRTPLNGIGYKFVLSKKPETTSSLTNATFPAITAATIDGIELSSVSQLQANKTVSVSWTTPSTQKIDFISLYGNGLTLEFDLKSTETSKLIGLGSAPITSSYAGIWLTARDAYGRSFVTNKVLAGVSGTTSAPATN